MIHIKDFYALISRELLTDTLTFAERNNPKDHDKKTIFRSVNRFFSSRQNEYEKKAGAA